MTKELLAYRVLSGAANAKWQELHAQRVAARQRENRPWNQTEREEVRKDDAAA